MKGKIRESQIRTRSEDVFNALSVALRKAGGEQSIYTLHSLQRINEDEWRKVCEWMINELRIN